MADFFVRRVSGMSDQKMDDYVSVLISREIAISQGEFRKRTRVGNVKLHNEITSYVTSICAIEINTIFVDDIKVIYRAIIYNCEF